MKKTSRKTQRAATTAKPTPPATSGYVGRPLDGSQYIDVIEEQEYADRRASPEEEKPRFSYLHQQDAQDPKP